MKRSSLLKIAAGIGIAGLGIYMFTRLGELPQMAHEIRNTPYWKIIIVVLCNPGTLFFRALRWRYLLPDKRMCSKKKLFPLVVIGFMVNDVTFFRIGEVVRAGLLWKRNKFTVAESVGSIIVERAIDSIGFVIMLIIPIFTLEKLAVLKPYGVLFSVGVGMVFVMLLLYLLFPGMIKKTGAGAAGFLPHKIRKPIVKITGEIFSNLDWIYSLKKVVGVILLTLATLACQVVMVGVLGWGIPDFTWMVSVYEIALAAVGAAIPLSPGYVGTLHTAMMSGVNMLELPADKAGAVVILYHALGYITIVAMGFFFFIRLKISFKDLKIINKDVASSSD